MLRAEGIAEYILLPKRQGHMLVGRDVQKARGPTHRLQRATQRKRESIDLDNRCVVECGARADSASKKLFEDQVAAFKEIHWDAYRRQVDFVARFGEPFLALQSFSGASGGGLDGPAAP